MNQKPLKLMIPGPIQPDEAVLEAMGQPVRPHYGADFTNFYNETKDLMKQVFQTQGDLFFMVGSGTVAIDACIGSALSSGETILVGNNGYFGERLSAISKSYSLNVIEVQAADGFPLQTDQFEEQIRIHPEIKAVAMVHLETSTTVVNPIQQVGEVCKRHNLLFIVDAVSSLGGLPFEMDAWGIDLAASATQKCLGAPPGLAPVAISPLAWEFIDRNPSKGHGWYGDLRIWRKFSVDWGDWHPYPVTMATNNLNALRVSLEQLLAEGIANRLERYRGLAIQLRNGLRRIGYEPFTPDDSLAPVLTAGLMPHGYMARQVVKYMEDVHRIKISPGLSDELRDKIIRIGHMSPTVNACDIDEVIKALEQYQG